MKKKPRIGRPPLAKRERKGRLLSVRFSDEERRALEQAAKRSHLSLSEWARTGLLSLAAVTETLLDVSSAIGTPQAPTSARP